MSHIGTWHRHYGTVRRTRYYLAFHIKQLRLDSVNLHSGVREGILLVVKLEAMAYMRMSIIRKAL